MSRERTIGEVIASAFKDQGVREQDLPKLAKDIDRYFNAGISLLQKTKKEITPEDAQEFFGDWQSIIAQMVKDYERYYDYKKDIASLYQETEDWANVFSSKVYSNTVESQEAFIDYVEEIYSTEVKDVKHLQELTDITHLTSYYDKKGKQKELKEDAQQRERALFELEDTLTSSRHSKYFRALETALKGGATYKDLLEIDPTEFKLPKDYERSNRVGSDRFNSILWAIAFSYNMDKPGLIFMPSLREIAKDLEAPYSVVMDAYNLIKGR